MIKSHIVPRAFYKPMLQGSGYAKVITNKPGSYDTNTHNGIYDTSLVCENCERLFDRYDKHASSVLLETDWDNDPAHLSSDHSKSLLAYMLPSTRGPCLKMFAMMTLWRMAASDRPEYENISIGPHLKRLRDTIVRKENGGHEDWSVVLSRFTGPPLTQPDIDPKKAFLNSHSVRICGCNCIKMYLADIIIHIKVDQRYFERPMSTFVISDGQPLYVIARSFESSKELSALYKIVNKPR